LLQKKANKHLIELLPERCARVRAFVDRFRPGLVLDVVPIADVAGPTAWDTNVQALVISRETQAGAAASASICAVPSASLWLSMCAVDKIRQEKGLPPLVPFVIDVISATEDSLDGDEAALKNAKMSSTAIRQWIADNESREVSRS
jgi:pantetheine-phosphate adenylyltransferase